MNDDLTYTVNALIDLIRRDKSLGSSTKRKARACSKFVASNPQEAINRLEGLYAATAPTLVRAPPDDDYARVISLYDFWRYNLSDAARTGYTHFAHYARVVQQQRNPNVLLHQHLDQRRLFPARHSWMAPKALIKGKPGTEIKELLRLTHDPPYVVMTLSRHKMDQNDVTIRKPVSLDAIPGRLLQWDRGDVPGERVDGDIPYAALGSLAWMP